MICFDRCLKWEDVLPDNIKNNSVGEIIASQKQDFPPESSGTNREYHAFTRGFILNEIFRRADPKGRTMGEYLREEISGPLEADAFIGLKESELKRCCNQHVWEMGKVMRQVNKGGRVH